MRNYDSIPKTRPKAPPGPPDTIDKVAVKTGKSREETIAAIKTMLCEIITEPIKDD